jgi:NADPH-dependent 2,4-dienoyl-CoA reductase/sulfur reductase-like enzyme/bacterioferritin-associated ferredoxin
MAATDVAVVGAGPAGLSAALTAASLGLRVTLIDELPAPGGQYLVGNPAIHSRDTKQPPVSAAERQGLALLESLAQTSIETRFETLVWHLANDEIPSRTVLTLGIYQFPPELGGQGGIAGKVEYLTAGAVILASGARERVVPFPGWTLPGVMTVGAAQLLAKRHGVVAGRRVLLAGSGPLLLPAAVHLAGLGAEVVALLEATHPLDWLRHGPAVWGNPLSGIFDWDRINEGRRYLAALRKARIPYRFGQTVVRAWGAERLEAAVVARLDSRGRPLRDTEAEISVDALCVGFGFVPNCELAQLAGASLRFDPAGGGWAPELDEGLQTSAPGLFVAGEAGGIAGASAAMLEGRLAGLGAACHLGRLSEAERTREHATSAGRRKRAKRFGVLLNTLFAPPPGLSAITAPDTVICRCEEVMAGEVHEAIVRGATTLDALKTRTRVGQGPCQGRTCGPILARMLAQEAGRSPEEAGMFHVRPPVKPVPLAALAEGVLV